MQKNNCPADNKQEKKEIAHEPTTMENANNVGNAECATEPLPIPIVEEVAPVVPQHEADAAPVEANEEQEEQPEPEVFTGEELEKGLGMEVMKRIKLAKAVFDDNPDRWHPACGAKNDDGSLKGKYTCLNHYKDCFSYACYFVKKVVGNTAKAFSFISDGYLYATNLEKNSGREVFALRIKLDDMNPRGTPMVGKNDTKTTPVFKVISCTLCMYFYFEAKLAKEIIPRRICNIIHSMSPVVQDYILVQLVNRRVVETVLTEQKVKNHLFKTHDMTRKSL